MILVFCTLRITISARFRITRIALVTPSEVTFLNRIADPYCFANCVKNSGSMERQVIGDSRCGVELEFPRAQNPIRFDCRGFDVKYFNI